MTHVTPVILFESKIMADQVGGVTHAATGTEEHTAADAAASSG